jgi:hypothetical protein
MGPEAVQHGQAAGAVVHTAGLLGGDAALAFRTRFRRLRSPGVRSQLGAT